MATPSVPASQLGILPLPGAIDGRWRMTARTNPKVNSTRSCVLTSSCTAPTAAKCGDVTQGSRQKTNHGTDGLKSGARDRSPGSEILSRLNNFKHENSAFGSELVMTGGGA
jgi:hypothetical protein